MTWFSLPTIHAGNKAAFADARSASAWLATQPQANSLAMLGELLTQIRSFNTCDIKPSERFKTMSALRKVLFAVSGDCQRRYENKPLPLLPAEYAVLDAVCALWRECLVAYLHCLRACLDGDSRMVLHAAKVAHRAIVCLRMEQLNRYAGGAELDGDFWRNLHSVMASAETLNAGQAPVEDPMLGETRESSVAGQYAMALMLHMARPYALSRAQFAAVTRWLARWREQARIRREPDSKSKSPCFALDLASDKPLHDNLRAPKYVRWLAVGAVLRKIADRLEALAAGESPESLKLGSGLSAEACGELLDALAENLRCPLPPEMPIPADAPAATVALSLDNIYRVLGGGGLRADDPVAALGSRAGEQIAVFGHVVRDEESQGKTEFWSVVRCAGQDWQLYRPAGAGEARLALRSLVALQVAPEAPFQLAQVTSLYSRGEGNVRIALRLLPGEPQALLAEVREKVTSRMQRHPAFMLPTTGDGIDASLLLPAGVVGRAAAMRFLDGIEQRSLGFRLGRIIERGSDHERYALDVVQ